MAVLHYNSDSTLLQSVSQSKYKIIYQLFHGEEGLWLIGKLIGHEFELFHLNICLKDIGNLGIEKQPDAISLEGKLYVMVVGSVDNKIEIYFDGFDIFIAIGYDDGECLLMEFLKRGCKVHF